VPQDTDSQSRPVITLTPEHHEHIDAAVDALRAASGLYARGPQLVRLVTDAEGRTQIEPLPMPSLDETLTRVAQFEVIGKNGPTRCGPPQWLTAGVMARPAYPSLPQLRGITRGPILCPDGSVLASPGYDDPSRLIYEPDRDDYPELGQLGLDEAKAAARRLLEVVDEFPWQDRDRDPAAWLAYTCTLASRYFVTGPMPFFLAAGNIQGAGKDEILKTGGRIVLGKIDYGAFPKSDEEMEKRLSAFALKGSAAYIFSNVKAKLGGPALEAVTTTRTWSGRILGVTSTPTWPWDTVLSASANGAESTPDMVRRTIEVRLEFPGDAEALQKRAFKIQNLEAHLHEHRPRLLIDVLTILASYRRDGWAIPECKMAGFESWASVVPSALVWIGLPNVLEGHGKAAPGSDPETMALGALLVACSVEFGDREFLAGDLVDKAKLDDEFKRQLAEFCPPRHGEVASAVSVGRRLASVRARVVGGRRFTCRTDHNQARWRADVLDGAPPPTAKTPTPNFFDLDNGEWP
jgi:hypothetical protein